MRYLFYFLFILLAFGCTEKVTSIYSLAKLNFTTASSDSIVANIDQSNSSLQLKANIYLIEGECEIIVYDPHIDTLFANGDTTLNERIVFNKIYTATNEYAVDEVIDVYEGTYKLVYELRKLDDVAPNGNLKIDLINQY